MCLNCGFLADADIQASVNIGVKGLETLGISPSKLLKVPQKVTVTSKPELTGSRKRRQCGLGVSPSRATAVEKSVSLEVEPGNPTHPLNPSWEGELKGVGEWRNGEAILRSESPVESVSLTGECQDIGNSLTPDS